MTKRVRMTEIGWMPRSDGDGEMYVDRWYSDKRIQQRAIKTLNESLWKHELIVGISPREFYDDNFISYVADGKHVEDLPYRVFLNIYLAWREFKLKDLL